MRRPDLLGSMLVMFDRWMYGWMNGDDCAMGAQVERRWMETRTSSVIASLGNLMR